ncbi:unnamed protein product [Medioppia subpectinata]|uniref:Uncharacterized protein n=1 Tax=Medioppia subpectinata TaxID=1979941 RepID=A0A7R9KLU8_9ACAR|nr:unnamed protein product [Medioppia subpectinata]CAG2105621.1 unnamed protein product [Medioppia subpectinata]
MNRIPNDVAEACLYSKLGPSRAGDDKDRHRICCSIWSVIDCGRQYEQKYCAPKEIDEFERQAENYIATDYEVSWCILALGFGDKFKT